VVNNTKPFDVAFELNWIQQPLFYADSVRQAFTMSGPDHAAFKHGWWDLTRNLQKKEERLHLKQSK
jgi:hydroxylamine dehydrogenase